MYPAVRDCMVAFEGFESPAQGMKLLGVEWMEIQLDRDYMVMAMDSKDKLCLATDDDAKAYRQRIEGLGIKPYAFLTACDFSAGDMDSNIQWIARAVELANIMGMSCIRIDSAMSKERELTFGERVDIFAIGLGGVIERTSGLNVGMGIENHGFQGNNLAFLLNVFKRVGSDRLGMTLDTGNFYWRGYPLSEVYGILNILAPYAKHTHLKNIKYPEDQREVTREAGWEYGTYSAPLYEGDIDHGIVLRLLKDAGYDGDICIEDESVHKIKDPAEQVRVMEQNVAHVKELIANLG